MGGEACERRGEEPSGGGRGIAARPCTVAPPGAHYGESRLARVYYGRPGRKPRGIEMPGVGDGLRSVARETAQGMPVCGFGGRFGAR